MNRLSQMYVADMTLNGSKGGYPEDAVLRMVQKHGEVLAVRDVPWEYAHREEDSEKRKYCFTREYKFEDGLIASLGAQRAGIPRFEPLEENPVVLDATEFWSSDILTGNQT